jgi:NADH:ubiquinone oxidoreductase subunit F (NADH-binding)
MEIDPHAVVEGLALAAFAVGAREARLAVKADYRLAIRRLRTVIRTAEEQGYLGSNAMNAGFDLHITVHPVQGAFVLGEETALLRALENKRLQPDQRPPYPTAVGLWGRPTVVNNVETLAAVPAIVDYGGAAYRGLGVADAPGTTLVQVSGAVRRPGVAEVPLGTTLREALQVAGGGRGRIKAALMGGPSGGFLPPASLDTPILYGPLTEAGAIMGSGTLLFADESACIVDLVNLMQRYLSDEACGKTIPCRIGTRRLCEITDRFVTGRPRPTDPQLLLDLASDVRDGALCQLEYTAPNPLLSGVRYFGQEFEDHILRSTCSAGVCRPLRVAAATS